MTDKLIAIKKRLDDRQIQVKSTTYNLEFFDKPGTTGSIEAIVAQIPEEREFKNLIILDNDELDQVDGSQFEKYRFIKGYEAVWSEELHTLECEIQSDDPLRISSLIFRRLGRVLFGDKDSEGKSNYELPSPHVNLKIIIGEASSDFTALVSLKREVAFLQVNRMAKRTTLRIDGLNVHTHAEALDSLNKLGNSILFQIDLATNIPIHFAIDRDLRRELRTGRRKMLSKVANLTAPKFQYDEEAISLYWYARTAQNMPLLQYLAFYQVLEFYFPVYSYAEAQHRIRNLLKNPTFDPNNDTDISQVLNTIKVCAKGRAFGDERSQLRSTIINCIDNESIWDYFNSSPERKDFFDVQKKSKSLAKQKISFSNTDADLRNDVSTRVYELRCRIVHTKEEDEYELILPFSPEVGHIKYDLELIEFLARKVLIASSQPLQLLV